MPGLRRILGSLNGCLGFGCLFGSVSSPVSVSRFRFLPFALAATAFCRLRWRSHWSLGAAVLPIAIIGAPVRRFRLSTEFSPLPG
jgi:hypothetical protein